MTIIEKQWNILKSMRCAYKYTPYENREFLYVSDTEGNHAVWVYDKILNIIQLISNEN